ncbi:MAG TPA: alpha-amylase family glycosyl hydrolase, partial [Elusimicrobiales bacterium]|nr:alpha-amylase family glycosyl hydrolase [Elusimicrobiales bacterium]
PVSPELESALLDGPGLVRLIFNRRVDREFVLSLDPRVSGPDRSYGPVSAEISGGTALGPAALVAFEGLGSPDPGELNSGLWEIRSRLPSAALRLGGAVYGPAFASDEKMGLFALDGRYFIRVFAPFATKVEAVFYRGPGAPEAAAHPLRPAGRGLWEAVLPEDPGGCWKMRVTAGGKVSEGLDPSSASVTAHDGLALTRGDASPVSAGPDFGLSEAVIYELNVRDFTIDASSGVREPGKYLGLAESGAVHPARPGLRTGLDHLSELGVNVVHIMPFQDFENDEAGACYNWGYMTVNFNSPDGWYATGLYDGERVRESKAMIDALHKKGIKVVMDVVYNHTAETRDKAFNFNVLAKDYYYRTKDDGSYWNGSGCGNEFRSEAPMGRKFIMDSLLHWLTEYKVDGFRFDLMGLIDLDTVSVIVKRLKEVKPDVIIYGEPWAAGPTPVKGVAKGAQRSMGYAVFNDG